MFLFKTIFFNMVNVLLWVRKKLFMSSLCDCVWHLVDGCHKSNVFTSVLTVTLSGDEPQRSFCIAEVKGHL